MAGAAGASVVSTAQPFDRTGWPHVIFSGIASVSPLPENLHSDRHATSRPSGRWKSSRTSRQRRSRAPRSGSLQLLRALRADIGRRRGESPPESRSHSSTTSPPIVETRWTKRRTSGTRWDLAPLICCLKTLTLLSKTPAAWFTPAAFCRSAAVECPNVQPTTVLYC